MIFGEDSAHTPLRWSSSRPSSPLTQVTGFKPRVSQIYTGCHRLATDATLHCVPWPKLRRWTPPTATPNRWYYNEYNENLIF